MVNSYGRRRLPYPYSYITELVQDISISSVIPDESIIDPDCNAYTVVLTPTQLRRFTSALQAGLDLIYPDAWQDLFTSWDNARINPNNPFWIPSECLHMDFCALVETCVETNPGVRERIRELIQESGVGGQDGVGVVPLDNNLDCIYGATESSYDLLIDWWLQVKVAVDAATQLTDAVSELIPAGSWLAIGLVQGLEALLTAGTAAYEAWINSAAVENAFRCGIFDSICGRGLPYQMTDDDINAGFTAIEAASPPVELVTGVIKSISTYGALKQLWQLRTDDTCSNDWETLCNCTPFDWSYTIDFSAGQGNWFISPLLNNRGVWSGQFWTKTNYAPDQNGIFIQYDFSASTVINYCSIEYNQVGSGSTQIGLIRVYVNDVQQGTQVVEDTTPGTGNTVILPQGALQTCNQVVVGLYGAPQIALLQLTGLTLKGTGANPFV